MSDTLQTGRNRRATILASIAVVAALATAGAARYATRPLPHELFEQGLAASRHDPAAGERLFRRAMDASGGRYPDAQIALCHALARQGLWDKALSVFATVETQACRDDLLLAYGRDALQAGQRSTALEALQAASQRGSPASVAALELLRAEYHESGQQDEETAVAYKLTQLESDNPDHWKVLLELLEGQHKMLECEEALREVLQQELPDAYRRNFEYMLIRILVVRGQVSEARRKITDLKTIEGQSFRLSVTEIDLYRIEGRWDLALAAAKALSPDAKNLPVMYHVRGVLYLDLEHYEEAALELERAVSLRPYNERAHFKLSEAYRLLRRENLAAQHGRIAAEIIAKRKRINDLTKQWMLDPQDRAIVEQLAELHAELGDEKAAHHWRECASRVGQAQSNSR